MKKYKITINRTEYIDAKNENDAIEQFDNLLSEGILDNLIIDEMSKIKCCKCDKLLTTEEVDSHSDQTNKGCMWCDDCGC